MSVSVFLGFTIQHTFVRRWFVPILMEAHAQLCGAQGTYVLFRNLVQLAYSFGMWVIHSVCAALPLGF